MNKILMLCILALVCNLSVTAQEETDKEKKNGGVSGYVIDADNGEPLINCNVMVMTADTTRMIVGCSTDRTGAFTTESVRKGTYLLKISYIGYDNLFRTIKIDNRRTGVNLGRISLKPSSTMLTMAVVNGKLQEVMVNGDTIQYNSAAFKVAEGSVLEELIKKLPGAEVEDDGTIKINGKTVKKILVEGKEFFGGETSMAMKNLPTEIVDKIKTYDKQSDNARITGIDDGQEETVIDLTIKKGMKNGWFGNINGGVGTKDRYNGRIMVNRFQDDLQASILGNYGNTRGNGTSTNGQTGININADLDKVEVGGNVNYGWSDSDTRRYSSSQNFVTTNTSFSNSRNNNKSEGKNAGAEFKIEWAPDSLTRILFRPNLSINDNNSRGNGLSATFNSDPYTEGVTDPLEETDDIDPAIRVNRNETGNRNETNNFQARGNLLINRRLAKPGRNVALNFSGNYNKSENESYSMSDVNYYQQNREQLTYRFRTTPNTNKSFTAGLSYTEPLADRVYLQFSYRYEYTKRHSDGATYDLGDIADMRDSLFMYGVGFMPYNYQDYLDHDLSRYTDDENKIHNIELQLRVNREKNNFSVGVNLLPQTQKIHYAYQGLDTTASRSYFRMSPTLNYRYRFTKQHQIQVRYRGNLQQPAITDMFSMTDNSDPLNIREGNPSLKPAFNNNLTVDYRNYIPETNQSYVAGITFSNTLNSISSRTQYNEETGGRITRPENINGNWSARANFGFNTPLPIEHLSLNTNTSANYNNNVGYIYQNQQTLRNKVKNLRLSERIDLTWRQDAYDVRLHGNINYNNSRSELMAANNRETYDYSYGISSSGNFDNGFGYSTSLSFSSRRGYSSADMNTDEAIWNAQISYRFLQGRRATISLQANDLLQQRSNISRMISATMRQDSRSNAVYSYAMLTFAYRFGKFGGRRGRQDFQRPEGGRPDFQRPEGGGRPGGGGGRGPGGGGPGGRM